MAAAITSEETVLKQKESKIKEEFAVFKSDYEAKMSELSK